MLYKGIFIVCEVSIKMLKTNMLTYRKSDMEAIMRDRNCYRKLRE